MQRCNGLAETEEDHQLAQDLEDLFSNAEATVAQLLDLHDQTETNLREYLTKRDELMRILTQEVLVPVHLQMMEAKDAVHAIDSQTNKVTLLLLLVGLSFVCGGALLVYKRISHPVNVLVAATNKVAEGDLSVRVDATSNDEIGLLGSAFNEMISNREQAEAALVLSEEQQRHLADQNAVNATIGRILTSTLDLEDV